ncbi:unnamed protein product [Adineta ricciae]|uniref:Uncharacterized protein n=1 Tax=Adineta ricciae TaxID=249248 RepID=A0A815GP63_ADIRI|nr:unnamed protein product [Adineta ricciae]CAF1342677.1 unnamed protein product [Adineta ricciae]
MNECQLNRKSDISSPTVSTDSGIQMNIEQLAMTTEDAILPSGWERFEDEQGVYYWHKRTGTVTRERPDLTVDSPSSTLSSSSSSSLNDACFDSNSLLDKSDSSPSIKATDETTTQQHRFYVRSLGWTVVDEQDLTTERSSRTVNHCIHELTRGINDGIGRWGEGKDLYMDINNTDILLIDPSEMTILHKQAIPSIRVWGVGRENARDFAYVAKDKDKSARIYKCHVFRCDNASARIIANTLRDICRNLMMERGLLTKTTEVVNDDLSIHRRSKLFAESSNDGTNISFPSPIEEPMNDLFCTYLGCVYVDKPGGMEVLRPAIERVSTTVPEDKWLPVTVNISPSSFTISSNNDSKEQLLDCRIRYLSFLGVGQDPTFCGIIIHCADNSFKCHVFHCLPSCIQLCKNIEAACRVRYQKCIDAHPQAARQIEPTKSYGAQLKSLVESFWFGNKQSV